MSPSPDDNDIRVGLETISDLLRQGEYADAEQRLSELAEQTGDDQLNDALRAVRSEEVDLDRVARKLDALAKQLESETAAQDGPASGADPADMSDIDELGREDSPFEMFEEVDDGEDDFDLDESLAAGLEELSEMDEDSSASFEGGEQAPTRVAGSLDDIAGGPGRAVTEQQEPDEETSEGDESDSPVGGTRMGAPQPRSDSSDGDGSGISNLMQELAQSRESSESSGDEDGANDTAGPGVSEAESEEPESRGGPVPGKKASESTQQGTGFQPGSDDQTTAPRKEAPDPEELSSAGGDDGGAQRDGTLKGEPGLSQNSSAPSITESSATQRGAPGFGFEAGDSEAKDTGSSEEPEQDSSDDAFDIDLGLDNPGSEDTAGVDLDVDADSSAGVPETGDAGHETSEVDPVDPVEPVGVEETATSTEQADESDASESSEGDSDFDLTFDWGDEEEADGGDQVDEPSTGAGEREPSGSPNESEGPRYDVESSRADAIEEANESRPTLESDEHSFGEESRSQRQTAPGSGLSVSEDLSEEDSEPVDEDRFMELADSISNAQKEGDSEAETEQGDGELSGAPATNVEGDATDSNEATQAPFMKEDGGSGLYAEGFKQESEPTSGGGSESASPVGASEGDDNSDSHSGAVRLLNEARRLFEDGHLESAHDLAQSILEQSGGHQGAENLLHEIRQAQRSSRETAEREESPTPRSVETVDPSNPPPEAIPPEDLEPADEAEVSTVEGRDPAVSDTGAVADETQQGASDGEGGGIEDMTNVPVQAVAMDKLAQRDLDHRYGFVFSLVDGQMTFEDIVDVCSMPREETLDVLAGLKERSLIEIDSQT